MERKDLVQELEQHVDKHGLMHVLAALDLMCSEKALHLESSWQDKKAANSWTRDGKRIYSILAKLEN